MKDFSIVTFNILGVPFFSHSPAERVKVIAQGIQDSNIDVINLQEVHTYQLLELLKTEMTQYPFVNFEKGLYGAKGGLVTFSKYPISSASYVSLAGHKSTLWEIILTRDLRNKGVLITCLEGLPITIFNTHLTANISGDWTRTSNKVYSKQQKELDVLTNLLKNPMLQNNFSIITGDFNIPSGGDLYQHFISNSGSIDLFQGKHITTYHKEFLPPDRNPQCIDYVFIHTNDKKEASIQQTSLFLQDKNILPNGEQTYLSDHIGLLMRCQINIL